MHTSTVAVCLTAAALIICPSDVLAARAGASGGSHNTTIIWDGSGDVPVSQGDGGTSTVASLGLESFAHLGILVTSDPVSPAVQVTRVQLLLRSNGMKTLCAAGAPAPPAACARVRPLGQVISLQSLFNLKIENSPGLTRDAAAALPTIGIDLVRGELPGLWRLASEQQLVLAEAVQGFGAETIRMGIDSEVVKDGVFRLLQLRDVNLPPPSASVTVRGVSPATGTTAGGTPITIIGSNFAAGATVAIDGVTASSVAVLNASTIVATTPMHAAAAVGIVITNPGGAGAAVPAAFTYIASVSNDNFQNRVAIPGFGSRTASAVIDGATSEAGEPSDLIGAGSGTRSIWWTWTAACTFAATSPESFIDTTGSTVDTVLGVFTGSSLAALTRLASDDDSGGGVASRVPSASPGPASLLITAGTVLQIRVRTYGVATTGVVNLHVNSPCAPTPTVDAIRPAAARVIPDAAFANISNITIMGSNFLPGATVKIGAAAAVPAIVLNSTTLLAPVNPSEVGAVNVLVTNPDGQTATVPNGFTYLDVVPAISSIQPTSGPLTGGTPIIIRGSDFASGAVVRIGGVVTPGAVVLNESTIMATTAPHAAGAVEVTVTNPVSPRSAVLANAFSFVALPSNDNFANRQPLAGFGSFTARGSNVGATFEAGEPGDGVAGPGQATVWWTWTAPCPAFVGAGASFIDTNGSDFDTVLAVYTGSSLGSLVPFASDDDSGDGLQSRVPSDDTLPVDLNIAAGTEFQIRVRSFGSTTGNIVLNFHSQCAPPPVITGVTPAVLPVAGGDITITGHNLFPNERVVIGGVIASVLAADPAGRFLSATAPSHAAGGVNLTVRNTDGQSIFLANALTYRYEAPTITEVFPSSGPVEGGTSIDINGTNFAPGVVVTIGGVPASNVSRSDTSIHATTGAHAAGLVDVVVTNPGLQASARAAFAYLSGPASITSISPRTGPVSGGTPVTITGTNFEPGATVFFDGIAATNVTVVSGTTITATTSCAFACPHATGPVDVVVSLPSGAGITLVNGFAYVQRAGNDNFVDRIAITGAGSLAASAAIDKATAEPDEPSDLIGSGSGTPSLWWTWTAPCSFTVAAPDSLIEAGLERADQDAVLGVFTGSTLATLVRFASNDDNAGHFDFDARVPHPLPGPATLNVTAGTVFQIRVRTFAEPDPFGRVTLRINNPCVQPPTPTVLSVTPPSGSSAGGTAVTVTGTNFVSGATLLLGGVPATHVTVVNSTTITARTGPHAAKLVDVVVANGESAIGVREHGFTYVSAIRTTAGDFNADGIADLAAFNPGTGLWKLRNIGTVSWGAAGDVPVPGDYDGNGTLDIAVYRPSTGEWFINGQGRFTWGRSGDIPLPGDYDGDGTIDLAVARTTENGSLRWYVNGQFQSFAWGQLGDVPLVGDFDGDRKVDFTVFRPASGQWFINLSGANHTTFLQFQWGNAGDIPIVGDYDGDGRSDPTFYRPATGEWLIGLSSTGFSTQARHVWGALSDIPVVLDLDGDHVDEIVVYRPSTATWYSFNRVNGLSGATPFGAAGDRPATLRPQLPAVSNADLDGDRRSDVTVFRPGSAFWFTALSSTNFATSQQVQWGAAGDIKVAGEYDGDGRTDVAVFRPSNATWYLRFSSDGSLHAVAWGAPTDIPQPADFDGDGKTDIAVYRPSNGLWFILTSGSGYTVFVQTQFGGTSGDKPVPADYDGDGRADVAIYRPSTGQWFINTSSGQFGGVIVRQWGTSTDVPLPGDWNGDGRADVAVFRPSTGQWLAFDPVINVSYADRIHGGPGDIPVAQDFDGDHVVDCAVFRPSTGFWYIRLTSNGALLQIQWGASTDQPLPQ
jgi:hypothetical protein